eukprot:1996779-Pyramimonas_sp.AAC.1
MAGNAREKASREAVRAHVSGVGPSTPCHPYVNLTKHGRPRRPREAIGGLRQHSVVSGGVLRESWT